MTKLEIVRKIDDFILEGNYIAAYGTLKEYMAEDPARIEYGGKIVMAIVDELDQLPGNEKKERRHYLRSLLSWIFRDIPGLAGLYREELRSSGERPDVLKDIVRNLGTLGDVLKGGAVMQDDVRETMDKLKRTVDETVENLSSGDAPEQVKNFFSSIEEGIRDGLKKASDYFEAPPAENVRDVTDEDDR